MPLQPGDTLLNGQYRIGRLLGRGGFGFVYHAQDTHIGEQVAIKELIPSLVGDEETLKRFLAEARATMRLTHKRIVRTHHVFPEGSNYYIVMEYMPGGSLEERLRASGPLPVREAVQIAADVCEGLACAHEEGVVHCDLKPANILFDAKGSAKVADFGIAHVSGEMLTRSWQTPSGFVAGTLPYMSPEQAAGVRDDPRIDVYALGAVLYRMLTGRTYLDFDQRETPVAQAENVLRIRSEQPVPPSAQNARIPAWLDAVVLKSLSKRPEGRYNSAKLMRTALLQVEQPVAKGRTPRQGERPGLAAGRPTRPAWFWPAAGAAALLSVLVFLAILTLLRDRGGAETPVPSPSASGEAAAITAPPVQSDQPPMLSPTSPQPTGPVGSPTEPPTPPQPPTVTVAPTSPPATPSEPTHTPVPDSPQSLRLEDKIAFSAQRANAEPDIYIMDPDGTDIVQLTFSPAYDSGPDWSPDGRYLAFHSNRSGNYDLYLMSRDGEQAPLKRLTTDPANDYDASWSPDGTQIVFMSERTGNREIFVMSTDGSNVHQLTNTAGSACSPTCERQPAWSTSGQLIAFESRRSGKAQIYAMAPGGQDQHPITASEGTNFGPKWSPGGLIAFASTRDPGNKENGWPEIYTTDLSGGNQRRLTSNTADDEAPAWSPDGQQIVFASRRDSCANQRDDEDCDWNLYVMRADGSGVQRLTNTPNLSEYNPVWWGP